MYYFVVYKDLCPKFSTLEFIIVVANLFWIVSGLVGIFYIQSNNKQ